LLHGSFLFFNSAHIRPTRTLMEHARKLGKLIGRSSGIDFHSAIVEIARVAGKSKAGRGMLGEVTEANALDVSANHPVAGYTGFGCHAEFQCSEEVTSLCPPTSQDFVGQVNKPAAD
jgi:hypothetical protein